MAFLPFNNSVEADLNAILTPALRYDERIWKRLARVPEFELALEREITAAGPLHAIALRFLAIRGQPRHLPLLTAALAPPSSTSSISPAVLKGAIEGIVIAGVHAKCPPEFRHGLIRPLASLLAGTPPSPLEPTAEMHAALRQLPEALARMDIAVARAVVMHPEVLVPTNLAIGHILEFAISRYDERVRGVARLLPRDRVLAICETLAAGPWIVPDREVERYVRVALLKAIACVDPPLARLILKTPALLRLTLQDLKDTDVASEVDAIIRSMPSAEDAVYWAEDRVDTLPRDLVAVLAAYQLCIETLNDGLEHALAVSMAPDLLPHGFRLLQLESLADEVAAACDSSLSAANAPGDTPSKRLESHLIKHRVLARRRIEPHLHAHAELLAGAPGTLQ